MNSSFKPSGTIRDFQDFIGEVYSLADDRLYSISDIINQKQRFTTRALKGLRKRDVEKLKYNLLIAMSWFAALGNRLHIDIEDEIWKRFPALCSYCGHKPCKCKSIKPKLRTKIDIDNSLRPVSLDDYQKMFSEIYPHTDRTLADAGVHLAEEMGEVSEAVYNYLGQHLNEQFEEIKFELADFASCIFGLANSAGINISQELSKMYEEGCHICHKSPCVCGFSEVAKLNT